MENYNEFDWLNGELLPDEVVLWRGKPNDKILFTSQDMFLIPFSLVWFGFAVFWEITALSSGAPGFFPLFGIPFVCFGIYFAFGRFIHQKFILKNTRYVLTNSRAIFYNKGKITCFDYKRESSTSLKLNKDGSGTISFGYDKADIYSRRGGSVYYSMSTNAYANKFVNIPDAHNVHQIINQQKMTTN